MNVKKIISGVLSLVLIIQTPLAAGISGTPSVSNTDAGIECSFNSEEAYYPVGDTTGKSIYTKNEVVRDCNVTREVQGECILWSNDRTLQSVPSEAYSSFDQNNYTDSVGSFFAMAGAYDQMEHLWSGFEGYCVEGTLRDFDWTSDPLFWASLAMGYLMAGGEAGAVSDGFNSTADAAGEAALTEAGKEAAAQTAMDSMSEVVIDNAQTELWEASFEDAAAYGIKQAVRSLGKCIIGATYNMALATANFLDDGSGSQDEKCNPIDEICEPEGGDGGESDLQTMDIVTFTDLANGMAEEGDNIYDFLEVVDDGSQTGVVTFRYIAADEMGMENMDMDMANELMEKMRRITLAIGLAIAAGGLAACVLTDGAVGGGTSTQGTQKDSNRQMLQSGLNAGIDMAAKFAGPYGPAIAVIGKLLVALAMSYQSIDSCDDDEDAKTMGSRHEKTEKALRFNLCRPMWDTCEDKFFWGKCALDGYHFCCYDQLLTKILVEQMKAELGREWTNCTGISIRDLNYVSFRQCTDSEMADGIDGAHAYGMSMIPKEGGGVGSSGLGGITGLEYDGPTWNPMDAFQYKHKCMDLTEFKDFLAAQIGEDIDMDTFEDFWSGLTEKQPI